MQQVKDKTYSSLTIHFFIHPSFLPSVHSPVHPSTLPSILPSLHPYIRQPSILPSALPSAHTSVHPFVHSFVHISIYSFIFAVSLFLSGRTPVKVLPIIEYHCQQIDFSTPFPSSSINIQLSIHEAGTSFTYEASVSWIELVKQTGFTGCVATSGPISTYRLVSLQWMAFDDVPNKGMMGIQAVSLWTTGTKCVTVDMVGMVTHS